VGSIFITNIALLSLTNRSLWRKVIRVALTCIIKFLRSGVAARRNDVVELLQVRRAAARAAPTFLFLRRGRAGPCPWGIYLFIIL
jgi:hypothetical protein